MEKLRIWIIFGLLGLMLTKACVIPLLYLDYEIRRDYIAANLCENRARPQLNCNGKCYLAKQIAKAQKQEQEQAEQEYMSKLLLQPMDIRTMVLQYKTLQETRSLWISFDYLSPTIMPAPLQELFEPPIVG